MVISVITIHSRQYFFHVDKNNWIYCLTSCTTFSQQTKFYMSKYSFDFISIDHMMFLFFKLERGHFFQDYFISVKILDVDNFTWFNFIDHMMFLLLMLERGHFFHDYFISVKILDVENFTWFNFIDQILYVESLHRPHDVLAFEAGAWSSLSSLFHSRQYFLCQKKIDFIY